MGPPHRGDQSRLSTELETLFALQEHDLRLQIKQREVDSYEKSFTERSAAVTECDSRVAKLSSSRKELVGQRALAERRVRDSQFIIVAA